MDTCVHFSRSLPSNSWWQTMVGCQVLSRPSAAEGGGRRPAFTGPATQPYSATEVDGWQRLSRVSQNRAAVHSSLPIRLQPTATRASVRPCSWTFTSVAIFGSHNRSQSFSDFFPTTRPAPPTWRRLAGAAGSFAPIVRWRESRSASLIDPASCAVASAAVTPD